MNELESITKGNIFEREQYRRKKPIVRYGGLILVVLALVAIYYLSLGSAPSRFPTEQILTIEEGATVTAILRDLKRDHYIRSEFYTLVVHRLDFDKAPIQAGKYKFPEGLSAEALMKALTTGTYKLPPVRITIPEGMKGDQIDAIVDAALPQKSEVVTASAYDEHIGYLFPDTYFVPEEFTELEFIELMQKTFSEKTAGLLSNRGTSTLSDSDVIILASILEREANSKESMRIVAGILLKRLSINMPLQVDATLDYLLDKESSELTLEDLEIDSPYNTYLHRGLPPTPIANPGLTAIEAVLSPLESTHLYYLTAPDGTFYYADTFEEHKLNKERYLR